MFTIINAKVILELKTNLIISPIGLKNSFADFFRRRTVINRKGKDRKYFNILKTNSDSDSGAVILDLSNNRPTGIYNSNIYIVICYFSP